MRDNRSWDYDPDVELIDLAALHVATILGDFYSTWLEIMELPTTYACNN